MTKSRGIIAPRIMWTAEQDQVLRDRYPHERADLIARDLGRPLSGIYQRAKKLGLVKTTEFYESDNSGRRQRGKVDPRLMATQFKPGQVPANKGLRRPGWAPGRMAATQFKKGRPAYESRNYVPIGTEKIDRKRNVLMRKITDDPSIFPVKRWRPVHVLVWEQHNGPVPEGHIVIFRQGMKTFVASEITVSRLELVTFAENMRRNSFRTNYPPEFGALIQLKGALTRKINARSKQS